MGLGFIAMILIGTVLLHLPISAADGLATPWSDALFTAGTATCVTGLVTVTTAVHWSLFGQIVILFLIQLGGLGIITMVTFMMIIGGKRISLRSRKLISDACNLDQLHGAVGVIRGVVIMTLVTELIGTIPYAIVFIPEFGPAKGLFSAFFNAVSAFCNAGMDIVAENSLANYVSNPIININTMLIIIAGGLGYLVWFDLGKGIKKAVQKRSVKGFWKNLNLHSQLVIVVTTVLIFGGAILILLFDWGHASSLGPLSVPEKIQAALFQSVTTRTAGFETIPQAGFTDATAMVSAVLMFIGGSPFGTAGGMKTTTVAIMVLACLAYYRGEDSAVVNSRAIRSADVRAAMAVITSGVLMSIIGIIALSLCTGADFLDVFYEVLSGVNTVGLTRGITSTFNVPAKIVMVIVMFAGRLGPVTLAMAMTRRANSAQKSIRYPEKRIMIG